MAESKEKAPVCTKGRICLVSGAPCKVWRCDCLPGAYTKPIRKGNCQEPCLYHFPKPIDCQGGRGRVLSNGCVIWQCNCPWNVCGKCIAPAKTAYGEAICQDPCSVHIKELSPVHTNPDFKSDFLA
jgi:hypothetical protein